MVPFITEKLIPCFFLEENEEGTDSDHSVILQKQDSCFKSLMRQSVWCNRRDYAVELQYNNRGGSRILEGEGADLTEQYQDNPRENHLSDSFVPFLNFKLKRPQRGGGGHHPSPDPPLKKVPQDWQNVSVITGVCFIRVLFHTLCHY